MNNGQTKPGYNIQIATEDQFITNYDIFWRPTDQGTLIPFLTSFSGRYGMQSDEVCANSCSASAGRRKRWKGPERMK